MLLTLTTKCPALSSVATHDLTYRQTVTMSTVARTTIALQDQEQQIETQYGEERQIITQYAITSHDKTIRSIQKQALFNSKTLTYEDSRKHPGEKRKI